MPNERPFSDSESPNQGKEVSPIPAMEVSVAKRCINMTQRWSYGTPLFALEFNYCSIPINNKSV